MPEHETQYPADFVDRLEILWGEGFLSPGGPEEVREIVAGIDLTGKSVLDIGCGTGGVDVVLAGELNASRVVAIDVQADLLDRAQARLESVHGHLAGKVEFKLVSAGPLDWPNETFDVVFSKDSLIHITDKAAMYDEVLRVLKSGGVEVSDLEGPLRGKLLEVVDEEMYQHWLEVRRALRDAVNAGAMRPTHLRGVKAS
jgi:phosphoethanolamine N-methyltransferase